MFIMQIYSNYIWIQDSIYNPQNVHIFQPCQDNTGVQTTVAGLMFKRNTCSLKDIPLEAWTGNHVEYAK